MKEVQDRLSLLSTLPERLDYHPEGNTLAHIKLVCLRAYLLTGDNRTIVAAVLLHDICKGDSGEWKSQPAVGGAEGEVREYWTNPFHPKEATELIEAHDDIRYWIRSIGANITNTIDLVRNHMKVKEGIPNKCKHIAHIDTFRTLDDMVHRFDPPSGMTYGYLGKHLHTPINYAGMSINDVAHGGKNYTITLGRLPMRFPISEIDKDLPEYITELWI